MTTQEQMTLAEPWFSYACEEASSWRKACPLISCAPSFSKLSFFGPPLPWCSGRARPLRLNQTCPCELLRIFRRLFLLRIRGHPGLLKGRVKAAAACGLPLYLKTCDDSACLYTRVSFPLGSSSLASDTREDPAQARPSVFRTTQEASAGLKIDQTFTVAYRVRADRSADSGARCNGFMKTVFGRLCQAL